MKKSILNLGKALNKAEQKEINGGGFGKPAPCGGTGGMPVASEHCAMQTHGNQWYNGVCYACY
jgi:hypothetical protein